LYKAVFSSSQDRNEIHTSTERCIEEMPSWNLTCIIRFAANNHLRYGLSQMTGEEYKMDDRNKVP
jgi:hypothetical protein